MKKEILIWISIMSINLSCSEDEGSAITAPSGGGIFTTEIENGLIEGELFLPTGSGPFPVLIVVPGSGNSSKEQAASFAPIINSFGYALYTYNKRGIGSSTGAYPQETVENPNPFLQARAEDVKGIVSFLRLHSDIKRDEIGLFGSSQGTWVNSLVYHDMPNDLRQIIMISGGATSTGQEHFYEQLITEQGLSIEEANQQVSNFNGNKGFDPLTILEKASLPILFIYGGLDDSHPTHHDGEIIKSLNNPQFEVHYYPNANHELVENNTGRVPDELFTDMESWLKTTTP